jgi:hypothetical protein
MKELKSPNLMSLISHIIVVQYLVHILQDQLLETAADAELATADAKDSLSCIKTMKECGPPVIERMITMLKSASNTIPTPRITRG